ncbi:MAG: homocysteine S-methyltransferase family protein [Candidatus Omnitrophica bacterium]|nr:homocysteine S-methyltransferase family protein [Candidatus Omnitrophota bacterium]
MKKLDNILKKRIVILDGAMGTQLQAKGLPSGSCPEIWCVQNKKSLAEIHQEYQKAGSDIIYTATFGANGIKLAQFGKVSVKKINKELALVAKEVAGKNTLVAGDIGPTGKLVEPFGNLKFDEAVDIFKEQVKGLLAADVNLFVIETMIDIQEARAALLAVRELSDKFTMVSMTFEKDGFTLGGTDAQTALITLQEMGASAFGCNCSTGPEAMIEIIKEIKPYTKVPILAKPNAGLPKLRSGETVFEMPAKKFASFSKQFINAGVNFLGGCCGTTPAHIKALKEKTKAKKPIKILRKSISAVSSARSHFIFKENKSVVIIGECINPTGKKELSRQLQKEDLSLLRKLAKEQQFAGANILDINISASRVDEKNLIVKVVNLLAKDIIIPLQIDSSNPEVIEKFLRLYPGRAIINSISADRKKMKKLLQLADKYGAMFIGLPITGKSIPKNLDERKNNIRTIYKQAKEYGFSKDDFLVDALVLAASSDSNNPKQTLQTIKWAKANDYKTVVGLSNVSFGLPKRQLINATFLNLAQEVGLDAVIANPLSAKIKESKLAADFLLAKKEGKKAFFGNLVKKSEICPVDKNLKGLEKEFYQILLEGRKEEVKTIIKKALNAGIKPDSLIGKVLIPALEQTGELFDQRIYFLPQLIATAEAAKLSFAVLQPKLKNKSKARQKTVVVLATVKGDIHDIGKNIVALMLENHGFEVIDLGKDVSASKIIQEVKRYKAPLVGLSALMTTTMVNMEDVVRLAKTEGLNCKFIVGGAVVTKDYAQQLGAQYAQDGLAAVKLANKLKKKKG